VPLEVARYVKEGMGLHESAFAAYRAVCPLSLDDLLNPGATSASGTATLKAPFGGAMNSCLPVPGRGLHSSTLQLDLSHIIIRPTSVYRLGEMPVPSCGHSVSAWRGKRYAEIGLLTD